jgi:hypothetical protein
MYDELNLAVLSRKIRAGAQTKATQNHRARSSRVTEQDLRDWAVDAEQVRGS